jgi:hypothetical protein
MRRIDRYILFGMPKIEGWLLPYTAEFLAAIADVQRRAGHQGAVGEIGVHHGKLFVLLCLASAPDERAFVVDVFEDQALNVDQSGLGDRHILENNLNRWCGSTNRVTVITKSSLDVKPDEILAACGQVRLASIDGGHTAECVYNDLRLIDAVIPDYGVVALDDFFCEDWPDVCSGAARYMLEPDTRLRPFAVTPNKVFLTTAKFNAFYRARLAGETPFRRYKTSKMFGSDVDVFHGPPSPPPIRIYVRETLLASPIGPHLVAARRAVRELFGLRRKPT